MDPVTASMIASAGISLGKGAHQAYKAHKLSQTKRPEYKTPKGIKQAGNIYRKRASGLALPGESMLREEIQGQQANLIEKGRGAGDPTAYLRSLSSATDSGIDAERQMRLKAIQRKDQATSDLAGFNEIEAEYQDKEFDINKMQPYKSAMASASALKEAAFKNVESGLNKGIGAAAGSGGAGGGMGSMGGGSAVAGSEGTAGSGTIGSPQPTSTGINTPGMGSNTPTSTGMSMPTAPTTTPQNTNLSMYPQGKVNDLRNKGFNDAQIKNILSGNISG